jgi:hypothetical protein
MSCQHQTIAHIVHHIHSPNKKLSHEFLNYIREYIDNDVFEVLKQSGGELQRLALNGYKGPHRAL